MAKEEKKKRVKKNLKLKVNLSKGDIYRESVAGAEHLVCPVVILVSGVHNRIFYPDYVVTHKAVGWNNSPVCINHPLIDGAPTSMNTPEQVENTVGRVFNSEGLDTKLIGETWLDIKDTEEKSPGLIKRIESGEEIDVSCSVMCELDDWSGEWNGEPYDSTVYSMVPDHLAILPDSEGACSFQDGCGLRPNESKDSKLKRVYNSIQEFLNINKNDESKEEEIMDLKSILAFIDNEENKGVKEELMKTLSVCPDVKTEDKKEDKTETKELKADNEDKTEIKPLTLEEYIEGIPCEDTKTLIKETLENKVTEKKDAITALAKTMKVEEAELRTLSMEVLNSMLEKMKVNDFSGNAASTMEKKDNEMPVAPSIFLG